MGKYNSNGIEYVGVKRELPKDAKLFGEVNIYDIAKIPITMGCIKGIISTNIECSVMSWKIIDTIKGKANDGTKLLGKKIIVDGEYALNVQYITDVAGKTVFVAKFKYSKFGEITVNPKINGVNIVDLDRREKIKITPYVEDLFVDVIGRNEININASIILNLEAKV